jgi:hypothetical protein
LIHLKIINDLKKKTTNNLEKYMAVALVRHDSAQHLERQDSLENVPMAGSEVIDQKKMRESAAKAGGATTMIGCGISKIAIGAALAATDHANVVPMVIPAMTATEELIKKGSKDLTKSGFIDPALDRTHAMTNSCVIL